YVTKESLYNKDLKIATVDQIAKLYYSRFLSKLQRHPNPLIDHHHYVLFLTTHYAASRGVDSKTYIVKMIKFLRILSLETSLFMFLLCYFILYLLCLCTADDFAYCI
ncbi:Uncharacterized protein FWK35_00032914, partial [Aphis craccivora]